MWGPSHRRVPELISGPEKFRSSTEKTFSTLSTRKQTWIIRVGQS